MGSIVNLTFHLDNLMIGNPSDEQISSDPEFTSSHMTFEEYVNELLEMASTGAQERFNQVPKLDDSFSAPLVEIAWIEMMKAHVYDMVPTTLTNATSLLEAAIKEQLTRKLKNENPEIIEGWSFFDSLTNLKSHVTLTREERKELVGFNDFERNTFIHQKTLMLLKAKHPEMVSVKKIELDTGEEAAEEVPLESAQVLWPVLKRRVEREMVPVTMEKAVRLTNRILVTT